MNRSLPYRQIHLDFHTSPLIGSIGSRFDADEFVSRLQEAGVQSINTFAKCHHGMCYYPTKVGKMHPGLDFDLLGSIINACHKKGILAPVYIATGWEEDSANHADWLEVSMAGILGGKSLFESGEYRWRKLCHNKEAYIQHILSMTDELIDNYDVDGFWYDIVLQNDCVCSDCRASMAASGLDPESAIDVKKNGFNVIERFMDRITSHVISRLPEASVYFNMHIDPDNASDAQYAIRLKNQHQTHIEIESLPSGEWGYNHFPLYVNYLNTFGKQIIGMNGKFHKSWGDFGTLKNREALEYECFRMIANGARCCIGDQMHPEGVLDAVVYERIGEVYHRIEKFEPFIINAKKVCDVGVLMAHNPLETDYTTDEGVMQMLLELHIPFDFIDEQHDLAAYRILVLPDTIEVSASLAAKIEQFSSNGGWVLSTGWSGIGKDGKGHLAGLLGIASAKPNPYEPSYILFDEPELSDQAFAHAMYLRGMLVKTEVGCTTYGQIQGSYFNRTWQSFCGHCQTPMNPSQSLESPIIVKRGTSIHCVYPIFTDYLENGLQYCRTLFAWMLKQTNVAPLVSGNLPSTAEVSVWAQQKRTTVHILHYIPQHKSRNLAIVDTRIPLNNVSLSIALKHQPSLVYDAETGKKIAFDWHGETGRLDVEVDYIDGYAMIVLES